MNISNIGFFARSCLLSLKKALQQRAMQDPELHSFVAALDNQELTSVQRGPFPRCRHHTMEVLATLLEQAPCHPLAEAVQSAASHLDWSPLYDDADLGGAPSISGRQVEGMLAAQMVGSYGCFAGEGVAAGILVTPSQTHYPLHSHAAREVYWCISGKVDVSCGVDEKTSQLSPGDHIVVPSNCLHALRSKDTPALLVYVWEGAIRAPTWWWVKEETGAWAGTAWTRKTGEPWRIDPRHEVLKRLPDEIISSEPVRDT